MSNLQRPSFLPLTSNSQPFWPPEFYSSKISKFVNSPSADSGISSFVSNSAVITPRTPISPSEFKNEFNNIKSPVYPLPLQNFNNTFKSANNSFAIHPSYYDKPTNFCKPAANSTPIKSAPDHVKPKVIASTSSIKKGLHELEEFYEYDANIEDDADDEDDQNDEDEKKETYYDLEFLKQFKGREFEINCNLKHRIKKLEIERKKYSEVLQTVKLNESNEDELDLNNNYKEKDLNKEKNFVSKDDLLNSLNACCDLDNCCCSATGSLKCPSLFVNLMALADAIFTSQCLFLASTPEAGLIDESIPNFEVPILQDTKYCKFCKNNREARSFYLQHQTRDKNGKVVCPILRAHKCELCGKTGDYSHTRSYCPLSKHIRARVADTNKSFLFYNVRSMVHHETEDFTEVQPNDFTDTSEDE